MQQTHYQFRRDIVVERETTTVSNLIVVGIESYLADQFFDMCPGVCGRGVSDPARGCYLIEHRLSIEVIALLEHLHQDLVEGMEARAYHVGTVGECPLCEVVVHHDVFIAQFVDEVAEEIGLLRDQQR